MLQISSKNPCVQWGKNKNCQECCWIDSFEASDDNNTDLNSKRFKNLNFEFEIKYY